MDTKDEEIPEWLKELENLPIKEEIPKWCTKLGQYLIEEIQIFHGKKKVFDSKKDINIYQEMDYEKHLNKSNQNWLKV